MNITSTEYQRKHKKLLKIILVWISNKINPSKTRLVASATSYMKETYLNMQKENHNLRITICFFICPYIYVIKDLCKVSSDVLRYLNICWRIPLGIQMLRYFKNLSHQIQVLQFFIHWHFVTFSQIYGRLRDSPRRPRRTNNLSYMISQNQSRLLSVLKSARPCTFLEFRTVFPL